MTNLELQNLVKKNLKGFSLDDQFEQRSVGDKIENDCKEIVKSNLPNNYQEPRSKKSTEDFTIFENKLNKVYEDYIDVKTHFIQEEEGFSMPNLISVDKLKPLLEDDTKTLSYLFVDYTRKNGNLSIEDVKVKYIWELDWSILGIGGLGRGQLQIKDANKDLVFTDMGKESWKKILESEVPIFYDKQIEKFKKLKNKWS
tara:strand:+ start:3003 stop:3599 length:597 start_codon:yes stop_codon:yes gene_type:complete